MAVGTCVDPYSLVALDIFLQWSPELIHALVEVVKVGKNTKQGLSLS